MLVLRSIITSVFYGFGGVSSLLLISCSGHQAAGYVGMSIVGDSAMVRVAAGPHYARGPGWQFFWGTHYRDLWTMPVTVPVLRLATAVPGGLTPMQAGGSYQSHTLRLRAANGKEYVLRSVDKDASAALPAGWRRKLLGGLMKDQTSVAQPYGAYVAAALAQAAGVYHTNPRLVYLSDDPALGKFRTAFANALYLLEERPDGDQRSVASFGHSPKVVNTAQMLTTIRQRPSTQVGARAYLRARLLDMLLGDWSRREDQWRWASFPQPGRVIYRPIPRDRDQAFFLFDDGVITRVASWFLPKFRSFHSHIQLTTVDGLTTTARALDRTLLAPLSAEDFRQEADSLQQRLTAAIIDKALLAGPAETHAVIKARFGPQLRTRLAQMPVVAQRYYKILAKEAWVVGTDKAERFIISGAGSGRLRVQLLAQRPNQPDSLVAERIYDRRDTPRLDLYGLGGDDIFELRGSLPAGPAVRIYDGDGHDRVLLTASAAPAEVAWYVGPDGDARLRPPGVDIEADPHPELTANGLAWLKRYNLAPIIASGK